MKLIITYLFVLVAFVSFGQVENGSGSEKKQTIKTIVGLQDSLSNTVKKIAGKGLSTNDFSTAYKNDVDANTMARHTHANQATLDATTASFLSADRAKLDGIAAGATENSTDAQLRDRSTHTGTQTSSTILDFNSAADARVVSGITGKENSITGGTTSQYWRGDKSFQTLDKTAVGLGNVDNTSDVNKPISTATQTAINAKQNTLNGTGFVKSTAGTITYDNSTYFPLTGGTLTGTTGNGFIGLPAQSADPTTPTTGVRLYANSTNGLSWIGANGFTRNFDGTANTANRSYTLQNASGTIPLLESSQTWTGLNGFSGNTIFASTSEDFGDKIRVDGTSLFSQLLTVGFRRINFSGSQALLAVSGNYNGTGDAQFYVSGAVSNDVQRLNIGYNTTGDFALLQATRMGVGNRNIVLNANGGNVLIGTTTDAGFRLDVNGTGRFTQGVNLATTSGNVGIGTTVAPVAKLQVEGQLDGGTNLASFTNSGTGRGLFVTRDVSLGQRPVVSFLQTKLDGATPALTIRQADPTQGAISINSDGSLSNYNFQVFGNGNITTSGNIGIGTVTPTSRLHTVGSQSATYVTTATALTLAEHRFVTVTAGVAITLPTASTVSGRFYTINARSTGVTISSYTNLAGTAGITTITNGTSITLISDGTNWQQVQ